MSFRELRSFTETMRILGYPQTISMESFREPNVELVADCLYWLINRYEPSVEVTYDIERESNRVTFFKQVCEAALSKGRIKLNIKKLYQADGHAVQEMLKLAGVLRKAMKATDEEEPDFTSLQQMAAQKNASDAKAVQQLCSELTADGSSLFFLVEQELNARSERQRVLSRATEVGEFERRLRELLTNVGQQVEQYQQSIVNLNADEGNLEQKIEGKKTQLERAQKRYKSLMAVRPAFIEEYEKHESQLQAHFVKYLEQYRNLEYLEHQLAKFNAREDELLEEQEMKLRVMRERLRKEELQNVRSGATNSNRRRSGMALVDGDDDDDEEEDHRGGYTRNAAEEGSSVSDSDSDDDSSASSSERGPRPGGARPQNALGGSRPSGPGPRSDDSDDGVGGGGAQGMQRPRGAAAGGRTGLGGAPAGRFVPSSSDDDSSDTSDLTTSSGSDYSSSDDSGSDDSDI